MNIFLFSGSDHYSSFRYTNPRDPDERRELLEIYLDAEETINFKFSHLRTEKQMQHLQMQ